MQLSEQSDRYRGFPAQEFGPGYGPCVGMRFRKVVVGHARDRADHTVNQNVAAHWATVASYSPSELAELLGDVDDYDQALGLAAERVERLHQEEQSRLQLEMSVWEASGDDADERDGVLVLRVLGAWCDLHTLGAGWLLERATELGLELQQALCESCGALDPFVEVEGELVCWRCRARARVEVQVGPSLGLRFRERVQWHAQQMLDGGSEHAGIDAAWKRVAAYDTSELAELIGHARSENEAVDFLHDRVIELFHESEARPIVSGPEVGPCLGMKYRESVRAFCAHQAFSNLLTPTVPGWASMLLLDNQQWACLLESVKDERHAFAAAGYIAGSIDMRASQLGGTPDVRGLFRSSISG